MPQAIVQFMSEDGTPFLIGVDEPRQASAIQQVTSVNTGKLVYQAKRTLEGTLD